MDQQVGKPWARTDSGVLTSADDHPGVTLSGASVSVQTW